MTIKDLAYRIQTGLAGASGTTISRSQAYELLAAAFGYRSYAAFGAEAVFGVLADNARLPSIDEPELRQRCGELRQVESVESIVALVKRELAAIRLVPVRIQHLVALLQAYLDDPYDDDQVPSTHPNGSYSFFELIDDETGELSAFLVHGLEAAASKSSHWAHYALALSYLDTDDDEPSGTQSSAYWSEQRARGEKLSSNACEWADNYERESTRASKAEAHMREAARLGNVHALLDLADLYEDPAFFEAMIEPTQIDDPARIAEIADRLGRDADRQRWLTLAADSGDIDAMLELIESSEGVPVERYWVYVYLAKLQNYDLTASRVRAYHDGGPRADQEYDDDFGGGVYLKGNDTPGFPKLSKEADAVARRRAEEIHTRMMLNHAQR